jgi:hypothetical protein
MFNRYFSVLTACFFVLVLLPVAAHSEQSFGTYHALVIGNNDYANLPKLETAIGDAEAVATLLEKRYGFAVKLLLDATRNDILRALNRYRADLTEDDNLLVYYAGHGWLDRQSNTGFWQPIDAEAEDDLNWIANEALTRRLLAMSARHVMVIADSCYSGTLVRSAASALPTGRERSAWLRRVAGKRSRTAIVSGGLEPVADTGQGGHSVFANALLSALNENIETLEATALFKTLRGQVVLNADQTPQYADIRRAGHEGGEFLFVPLAGADVAAAPAQIPDNPGSTRGGAPNRSIELAFWQSIQSSARPADFKAYLQQFPDGAFAALAKNRLSALQTDTSKPQNLSGVWVSDILTNPFEKRDRYQLHFDFKPVGQRLLGSIKRVSVADIPRKFPTTTRGMVEGRSEDGIVTFQEAFQVLLGSKTEDHRRIYTGELKTGAIDFVLQDTLGNPPVEFTIRREGK